MRRSLIIRTVFISLLGLALAFFGQSARLLQQLEAQGLSVQYSNGSPLSGTAFMQVKPQWQPVWLAVSWRWCPRLNIARWCVNANGDIGQAKGALSLGFNSLTLSNTEISASNIPLVLAGFVDATTSIDANIAKLRLKNTIALDAIEHVDATVLLSDINAMGFGFSPHRIKAEGGSNDGVLLTINGEEANGKLTANATGHYNTDIVLTPNKNIAGLLKHQLPEAPVGTFTFKHAGVLAVPQ